MYKIFLVEPILYNDIFLLKLGVHNISSSSIVIVSAIIFALLMVYYLIYFLFSKLFNHLKGLVFGKVSRIIIWTGCILILFNIIKSGTTLNANHVFQIASAKVIDNLVHSSETAKNISQLNINELNKKSANIKNFHLSTTPDIYLLFVESYGKIVFQDPVFRRLYNEYSKKCESELINKGWHITSNLSLSPISGGGSWISYTTVMFGFRFPNQGTYLYFLRNTESQKYTNIVKYFQSEGYKFYWINSMPDNVNMEIPWKLYTDFYGVDKWVTYNDLNYHGKLYGFGPSPPDQFSLFKAEQIIEQDKKTPKIVFYITHNSHNPFFSPDSVVHDWKTLDTGHYEQALPSMFIKKPKAADYIKSINYEIQVLTKFIIQTNNKQAIFIIIGDHQPPVLSTEKNGFETPVHIIAADSALINSFRQYGFSKGLNVGSVSQNIRHEAIYSMLVREILRKYGTDTTRLPQYLPMGLNLKQSL